MVGRLFSAFTCFLMLAAVACSEKAAAPAPDESEAVRAAFNGYKQAILQENGTTAVGYVDTKTLDYYRRIKELALHGESYAVRALSPMDKLMVLTIRNRVPLATLQGMTPESLFVHAVNEGWVGKESAAGNEVGAVEVTGDTATGVHVSRGQQSPYKWEFHKEDGRWKIDLTSIMPIADRALRQLILQSGASEDEFVLRMLEAVSGQQIGSTIWEPMARQ